MTGTFDDIVAQVEQSACTVSLVPSGGVDAKFAVELGVSVMLDKPIILIVVPGQRVPSRLARLADDIVEWDADGDATSRRLFEAVRRVAGGAAS